MIQYDGIRHLPNVSMIRFVSDHGDVVEIPLDRISADRILKYLSRVMRPEIEQVESDSDEEIPSTD